MLYNFESPTSQPSRQPSHHPSSQPSKQPTCNPTGIANNNIRNLVVDPGAEDGYALSGWTNSGGYTTHGWGGVTTNVHSGSYAFITMSNHANISQSLSLTVSATYAVSLWVMGRYGSGSSITSLYVNVGENTIMSLTASYSYPHYIQYTSSFTASSATETLQISGNANYQLFLDDISVSVVSTANRVVNPGAETCDMTGWTDSGTFNTNGWSAASQVEYIHSGICSFATESSTATITQSLSLTAFATYTASFWVYALSGTNTISLSIGSNTLISLTNIPSSYTQYTSDFIVGSTTETLQISGSSVNAILLDDISVTVVPNLVNNGGAELGMLGWSYSGTSDANGWVTYSTGAAHSGNIGFLTQSSSPVSMNQSLSLTTGTSYSASFWAKPANAGSYKLSLSVGGSDIISLTSLSGFYTQYNADFTADSAIEILQITGSAPIFLDDISVVALEAPTSQPSTQPSKYPSSQPSVQPTRQPIDHPSMQPSAQPSVQPSDRPSAQPSGHPSGQPSERPTMQPSGRPSVQPSEKPSEQPTDRPSGQPSARPSDQPTSRPTEQPTDRPSGQPSERPTMQPSHRPTGQPSDHPSGQPSGRPSIQPTNQPTSQPIDHPSTQPSDRPSAQPSDKPSAQPSGHPSGHPTERPTSQPSDKPSTQPSSHPSGQPTERPSDQPTSRPTEQPTDHPSGQPSSHPSRQPSERPSMQPTDHPTGQPNGRPSDQPTEKPSAQPIDHPSMQPSNRPSTQPTERPTAQPSSQPIDHPSEHPTMQPSTQPSSQPSASPSDQPSSQPTSPTSQPTIVPTILKKEIFGLIDLVKFTHHQGVSVNGKVSFDNSGYSVSLAGDVNNDGYGDVIIGAPGASPLSRANAGSAFIVYGSYGHAIPSSINLAISGNYAFTKIYGADAGDQCGLVVSNAGDVNKDGYDDVIISCSSASPNLLHNAGAVYVVYGGKNLGTIDLSNLQKPQGFAIYGANSYDFLGSSIASAGDINNDGYTDVVIGAPQASPNSRTNSGIVYVVFGKDSKDNIDLSNAAGQNQTSQIQGANAGDNFGSALSGWTDFNKNNHSTLIISASSASDNNRINSGTTYVIFGNFTSSIIDLTNFHSSQGIKIFGANTGDYSGYQVSYIGNSCVMIGAPFSSPLSRTAAGTVYVLYNLNCTSDIDLAVLNTKIVTKVYGAKSNDNIGIVAKYAGDINRDGNGDIAIGVSQSSYLSRNKCGESHIIYGTLLPNDYDLLEYTSSRELLVVGANSLDLSGSSISSAGDFNGDGFDDVIIGAPHASSSSQTKSGSSYVIYGGFNEPTSQPSSQPSNQPSIQPSERPSVQPFALPTAQPSRQPNERPSAQPSVQPSSKPTDHDIKPSSQPSEQPSWQPSEQPLSSPTAQPSSHPSRQPTAQPSRHPSSQPSSHPSSQPTAQPTKQPSEQPSTKPTKQPIERPTSVPSRIPSKAPVGIYSKRPVAHPTVHPSANPTSQPSSLPSNQPSDQPSKHPTSQPSSLPSNQPSDQPSKHPTSQPSERPTDQPTMQPSRQPTSQPNSLPSNQPSEQPSKQPTSQPSEQPSKRPTSQPSEKPTDQPTTQPTTPTAQPSSKSSSQPSSQPSSRPSDQPSTQPISFPTNQPSRQPTIQPSVQPSSQPSDQPSSQPTTPTSQPTLVPTILEKEIFGLIDLSKLTHYQAILVGGKTSFDNSGSSVSYAGDVNGDGYMDVIIGAPGASPLSRTNAGSVFVIYGSYGNAIPSSINLAISGNYAFTTIYGANSGDQCGIIVSNAGDYNKDGYDDVIISCYLASPNILNNAGTVYVIYGGKSLSSIIDLNNLQKTQGFAIYGANSGDLMGSSIASAGDINNDGFMDVLMGAPQASPNSKTNAGIVYAVFGQENQNNIDLLNAAHLNQTIQIYGANPADYFGFSLSEGIDFNQDNHSDIIVGASAASDNARINSGTTYVIFGNLTHQIIDMANFGLSQGIKIFGANSGDYSGYQVSQVGHSSLMIGAPFASPFARAGAGTIYVLSNFNLTSNIDLSTPNEKMVAEIYGAHSNDNIGKIADNAGDINHDGYGDVIIGIPQNSYLSRNKCGESYVVYGTSSPTNFDLSEFSSSRGLFIVGANPLDSSGISVSSAGDFNHDGFADLIIGALGASPNSKTKSGSSYILYGGYNEPTSQPSSRPSSQPILHPTSHPSSQPNASPSTQPTSQPSSAPSHHHDASSANNGNKKTIIGLASAGGSFLATWFITSLGWDKFKEWIHEPYIKRYIYAPLTTYIYDPYIKYTYESYIYKPFIALIYTPCGEYVGAPYAKYIHEPYVHYIHEPYVKYIYKPCINLLFKKNNEVFPAPVSVVSETQNQIQTSTTDEIDLEAAQNNEANEGIPIASKTESNSLFQLKNNKVLADSDEFGSAKQSQIRPSTQAVDQSLENAANQQLTFIQEQKTSTDLENNAPINHPAQEALETNNVMSAAVEGSIDLERNIPNHLSQEIPVKVIKNKSVKKKKTDDFYDSDNFEVPEYSSDEHDLTSAVVLLSDGRTDQLKISKDKTWSFESEDSSSTEQSDQEDEEFIPEKENGNEDKLSSATASSTDDKAGQLKMIKDNVESFESEDNASTEESDQESEEFIQERVDVNEDKLSSATASSTDGNKVDNDESEDLDGVSADSEDSSYAEESDHEDEEFIAEKTSESESELRPALSVQRANIRSNREPSMQPSSYQVRKPSPQPSSCLSPQPSMQPSHEPCYTQPLSQPKLEIAANKLNSGRELTLATSTVKLNTPVEKLKDISLHIDPKAEVPKLEDPKLEPNFADNDQLFNLNKLIYTAVNIRQLIEYSPIIKYTSKNIIYPLTESYLPEILKNITYPEFLESKVLLFTTHLAAGHIGVMLLPQEAITNGLAISTAGSGSFGVRLAVSHYLAEQRQDALAQDKPMDAFEVAKYCVTIMLAYTMPSIATCVIDNFFVPGYQCGELALSTKISLAGAECYSVYKTSTKVAAVPTTADIVVPYVADGLVLVVACACSGNVMSVVSSVVTTDYMSRLAIDLIPDGIKEAYVHPVLDYAYNVGSCFVGEANAIINYFAIEHSTQEF